MKPVLAFIITATVLLTSLSAIHAERVGVEVVSVGWGDDGRAVAIPGDENLPLIIKIKNADPSDLGMLRCTLSFSPPFYFEYFDGETKMRTLTQEVVLGGLRANGTATLRYSLSIDPGARVGAYRAELKVVYVEDPVRRDVFPIFLTVGGLSKLIAENLSITPETPIPGDTVELKLKIRNAGNRKLDGIEAELRLAPPLLPEGLDYYRHLSSLPPGEVATLRFKFRIAGDAEPGGHTIPLRLKYRDAGRWREHNLTLGLNIASPVSFEIAGVALKPLLGYRNGTPLVPCCSDVELEFDVVNTAREEASFVEVVIEGGENLRAHPQSTYVGTLSSDDFATVRFTLNLKEGVTKVPVTILYTDENNRRRSFTEEITVFAENSSAPRAKKEGQEGIISRLIRWLLGL
ncbi:MAG: hypothetical protein GXO66_06570 [Euryarchaeota archaeon]|nr:hypothetical protein [Euryarchaeota archaeon]